MSGDQAEELLGAYALDAVDDEERALVEALLRVDPHAQAEVAEHREVAGMLGWTGSAPPDGVWDRVVRQIDAGGAVRSAAGAGADAARAPRSGRSSPSRLVPTVVAAAVAAAAAVVVTLAVVDRDRAGDGGIAAAAAEARADPASTTATLRSSAHAGSASVVIAADGAGFLDGSGLPALPAGQTYQLWGVTVAGPISLGMLGPRPGMVAFSAAGPMEHVMVTVEPAGGATVARDTAAAYVAGP